MKRLLTLAAIALLGSSHALAAAKVDITWKDPESYRDVEPTNESKKKFRQRVFDKLEKHITELADGLPDGYTLSMTVTDLDLAGQVWPSSFVGMGTSGSEVRLVERIHIPRMKFSYRLTDDSGAEVKSAEDVTIKDMAFQDRIRSRAQHDTLRHEKNMLDNWFRDAFPSLLAKR